MLKNLNEDFIFIKLPVFLIISLPFTLVSGSFLPDLSVNHSESNFSSPRPTGI